MNNFTFEGILQMHECMSDTIGQQGLGERDLDAAGELKPYQREYTSKDEVLGFSERAA